MTQNRKLPIGIQSFASLRRDNYLYVDKTKYLYALVHSGKQYFLSRPRRFGKSLFLSTLRAYWEGKKDLFTGLVIEKLEEDHADAWKPHPVFYIDLNRAAYDEKTGLEDVLEAHLREWEKIYGREDSEALQPIRFQHLLMRAAEQAGVPCVVLVDEYDKPLLEVMHDPERTERFKNIFRGFFGSLKSFDEYIQFILITGVTKFNKISIFSDLNQLNDISLSRDYSGICGMTQEEITTVFQPELVDLAQSQEMTLEECIAELGRTYDGYHFHPDAEGIYNPFSLMKAMYHREFGSYWFETGTPTFLVKKLHEIRFRIQSFTDKTLFASEAMLSDYRADNPDPVPLLYQTGYLTIAGYDRRRKRYTLGFPNEEVRYGLMESLLPEYAPQVISGTGNDIFALDEYMENGDTDGIRDFLISLFAGIPYTSEEVVFEHYFQTVIYIVFTLLGKFTECEMHTYKGRIDCVVGTGKFIYLFEFKRDKTAEDALEQIEEKEYAKKYAADRRKLFKIGANFDSRERMLTEWKVCPAKDAVRFT